MNFWWWASIACMIGTALILLAQAQKRHFPPHLSRRFEVALRREGIHIRSNALLEKNAKDWLQRTLEHVSRSEIEEMRLLLVQAGWSTPRQRFYFLAAAWLLPVATAIGEGSYAWLHGEAAINVLLHMLFSFALLFVSLRRFLRWRAQQRQLAIRREVVTWLHLLRMLFDVGLSLEHTLQVLVQQGKSLIPNLAHELRLTLQRIEAGQDRSEALTEMATPLAVPELNDTVAMLKQTTRYGGNIREPLIEYTRLVEQRQVSELREQVGKLSAKMTMVMVIFLFPALMIFVAGPGFIGLANALNGIGG